MGAIRSGLLTGCLLLGAGAARAAVGSGNVAPIEPPTVPHPAETPCRVALLTGAEFGAASVPYQFAPPAACPGPWAKVVLAVDLSVAAGVQYDRTGTLWLDGVNLWFGTTAEPGATLAPSWHVERDVTDDTSLFRAAGTGHMLVANYQNSVDTSAITASATLLFYPATRRFPAPRTPDAVIPFASDAGGDTVALNTGTDVLSRTLVLPRNVERARFDAVLQGQNDDEFWYTCVPNADATALQTCGGGAFRQGVLTVDGRTASFLPVYPAIFTGGIDPFLWVPTPAVTTLDLRPVEAELTPFAGVFDDGATHTVSLSVLGANDYFSVEGALYLWLDHGAAADQGAVVVDDASAPAASVVSSQSQSGSVLDASVTTTSRDTLRLSGVLRTSRGTVGTTVTETASFRNAQRFAVGTSTYTQDVVQDADTDQAVLTADASGSRVAETHSSFPIRVGIGETGTNTDTIVQTTKVAQGLLETRVGDGAADAAARVLAEGIASRDTVPFVLNPTTGAYSLGTNTGAASAAAYAREGADGCAGRVLASSANVVRVERQVSGCGVVDGLAAEVPVLVAGSSIQRDQQAN